MTHHPLTHRMRPSVALLPLLALVAGACAEGQGLTRSVSYSDNARSNYEKGQRELKDENYPEALKYFIFVKNRFPFSHYATLAELAIADTYFAQEKFVEAVDGYKQFIRFHPTHPRVVDGYAAYRVAQAYVEQIPGDFFLFPPSHEKDQSPTRDAVRELSVFIRTMESSKYLPKVKRLYQKCLHHLADHELYVARFYLDQDKPAATILRLEGVLRRFPEAGVQPEVMLLLGQTYLKQQQRQKARATFDRLISEYPNDHHSAKAKLYVQFLERD